MSMRPPIPCIPSMCRVLRRHLHGRTKARLGIQLAFGGAGNHRSITVCMAGPENTDCPSLSKRNFFGIDSFASPGNTLRP